MKAFYRDNDLLVKAYDHGSDWQLVDNQGNERWFSIWSFDKKASLLRAFDAMTTNFCPLNLNISIDDEVTA